MFPNMDKEALIEALANTMTTSAPHQASKFQNWERLWEFMPDDVWQSEGTAEFASKAIAFLLRAGLRSPTEGTFRTMAVGLLLGGEDKDKAKDYDANMRQSALNMVKTWFRNEVAPYKNIPTVVQDLPQMPQLLRRDQSEQLYGERAAPGKNRLAQVDFQTVLCNTRCRRSKTPCSGLNMPTAVTWQSIETLVTQALHKQQTMAHNVAVPQQLQLKPQPVANVTASPIVPWTQHMLTPPKEERDTSPNGLAAPTPTHLMLPPPAGYQDQAQVH